MFLPRIGIIGGGPAGLLFARLLNRHAIPSLVFEADTHRRIRHQDGTLDLHRESGQQALKEAGLYHKFRKPSQPQSNKKQANQAQSSSKSSNRPKIDHDQLRDLMLDSLEKDQVQWDHRVRSVEDNSSNSNNAGFVVNFDNSRSEVFDVLIGADGVWSKVRQLLTPQEPQAQSPNISSQTSMVQNSSSVRASSILTPPKGFKWMHKPGITLIGDAAHLMPPCAEIGANMAMEDALLLTRTITSRACQWADRSTCLAAVSDAMKEYESGLDPLVEHAGNGVETAVFRELLFNEEGAGAFFEFLENEKMKARGRAEA